MPKCDYCGRTPFLTYCASFFAHVESCRYREKYNEDEKRKHERQKEQNFRKELEHQLEIEKLKRINAERIAKVQKNIYNVQTVVCGDQVNITNVYLDYPKTPFFIKAIELTEEINVDEITDLDSQILEPLQRNDPRNEIYKMMDGTSPTGMSHAYSFIADVVRRLREKMEKRPCPNIKLITEAKSTEVDCLSSKSQLKI